VSTSTGSGSPTFYGAIYAEGYAFLTLGTEAYGAVMALGHAYINPSLKFHYDKALRNISVDEELNAARYEVSSWQTE
jgi:hypothetical protein